MTKELFEKKDSPDFPVIFHALFPGIKIPKQNGLIARVDEFLNFLLMTNPAQFNSDTLSGLLKRCDLDFIGLQILENHFKTRNPKIVNSIQSPSGFIPLLTDDERLGGTIEADYFSPSKLDKLLYPAPLRIFYTGVVKNDRASAIILHKPTIKTKKNIIKFAPVAV